MTETTVSILSKIQKDLKAPKGQTNAFGGYKYRSCEDILEAVKPLIPEGYAIIVNDEIVQIGERYYVKATATITNGTQSISNSAYARESFEKKGMDESQITGATSSYARKYALNGLFAIDDTKDADTMDNTKSGYTKVSPAIKSIGIDFGVCDICGSKKIQSQYDEGLGYCPNYKNHPKR